MKILTKDLIKEFYKEIKEEYPDLTLEQVRDICYGPWRFLRREIETPGLETVRFKYIGTFNVYKNRARQLLQNYEYNLSKGYISESRYNYITNKLKKYIGE